MRHWIFTLFILLISTAVFGQSPEGFSYQAVARDASGEILANQNVGLRISILQGSISGSSVFTETHTATSNSFGLINLVIGQGMTSDSFSTIDWSTGPYFVKIEMDPAGGTSYVEFGTSQLLSVPYAMHSKTTENTFSGDYTDLIGTPTIPENLSELNNDTGFITDPADADSDPANEIQDISLVGAELSITDGSTVDLGALPSVDTDDQILALIGTELSIEDGNAIDLSSLPSVDTDDQTLSFTGTELTIEEGNTVDLGTLDTDDQTLVLNNTELSIEGGNAIDLADIDTDDQTLSLVNTMLAIDGGNTIDLVSLKEDGDSDPNNEIQNLAIIGHELSITGGNSIILPDEVNDPDPDPANELQDLILADHELTISGRNMVILPDNVDDADADPANELQTLSLTDNILTLDPGNQVDLNINFPGNNTFLGINVGSAGTFNTFVGWSAGNQNLTGQWNTFVGAQAGGNINSGQKNVFVGRASGFGTNAGISNTFLGYASGQMNIGGSANTYIGNEAGWMSTSGFNTYVGHQSGMEVTTGGSNTFLGNNSGQFAGTGSNNVYLGSYTGRNNIDGNGNIFLGHKIGENEVTSNKLLIGNVIPLIEGDFASPRVSIYGNLGVGTSTPVSDFEVSSSGTGEDIVLIGISSSANKLRISSGPNNALLTSGPSHDGTKGLIINHSTGNVGVGLVPSTKLDVDGVIKTPGGNSDEWNTAFGWGDHSAVGYITTEAQNLSDVLALGADAGNAQISNLADPLVGQDAATKAYVDALLSIVHALIRTSDPTSLIEEGISIAELLSAGVTFTELFDAGVGVGTLEQEGVSQQDLIDAGLIGMSSDIDGNSYKWVKIGPQTWFAENLKVSKLNDGTPIQLVTDDIDWGNLSAPGYCWYNNQAQSSDPYGALYNWYTVNTGQICPSGWHVPSDGEWTTLVNYLDGTSVAGGKLKELGVVNWNSPNVEATNESGFTALPGGRRFYDGVFSGMGDYGQHWSSTEYDIDDGKFWLIYRSNGTVFNGHYDKEIGYTIRCIKD